MADMKSLIISGDIHAALKRRAEREARTLRVIVTQAFADYLGPEFPKNGEDAKFLPKRKGGRS